MAATRTYIGSHTNDANASSYTFSGVSIGSAASDRIVVVCIGSRKTGGATSVSSATIAGVSATVHASINNTIANNNISAIITASVPTGTTGDIVINFADSMLRCGISVYTVTGSSTTPHATDTDTSSSPAFSLNVPAGGACIATGFSGNAATETWTGLTEDVGIFVESVARYTSASDNFASAQTPLAITCGFSSSVEPVGCAISFAAGGLSATVGLVTETDSTFALSKAKTKAVGLSSTTDSALALSTAIVQSVGLASETNTTFALNSTKAKAVGLNSETNATFALAASKAKSTGLASETNATFGLTVAKSLSVGLTSETNTAFSVTAITPGGATVGLATETDSAFSLTSSKVKAVGLATETNAPLAVTAVKSRSVGLASTTDTANSLGILKALAIGLASETNTAITLSTPQMVTVGLVTETNSALALATLGLASWVYTVPAEQRIITVAAEARAYTVPAEARVIEVSA